MIKTKRMALISLSALGMAATASAQTVGEVTRTGGEPGSVIVTRDGNTYTLLSGDTVFADDVVTTRSGGEASISAFGCTVDLAESQSVSIDERFCNPGSTVVAANPERTPSRSGGGSGVLIGAGGAILLVGLAAGGGGGGGGGSAPTTPVSP